jgi:hypothetical protein
VLSCVGRGLGAGLIPHPRSPTKCVKGSISKKKNPTPEKGIRKMRKKKKKKNLIVLIMLGTVPSGGSVYGAYGIILLEHWDRGFESHS